MGAGPRARGVRAADRRLRRAGPPHRRGRVGAGACLHRGVPGAARPALSRLATWALGPRPVRQPRPPIWIGGSSPAAIRRTAAFGDGWLPQGTRRRDLPGQIARLRELRAELRGGAPLDIGTIVEPIYLTAGRLGLGPARLGPHRAAPRRWRRRCASWWPWGSTTCRCASWPAAPRSSASRRPLRRRGGAPAERAEERRPAVGWRAMSFLSYALGAIVLIFVLLRQVRVRPGAPGRTTCGCPIILGVIGLFEMPRYAGDHHVSVRRLGLGDRRDCVVGAGGWVPCAASPCGCGRPTAGSSARATAVTMALWLVSLLVHFAGDTGERPLGRGRPVGRELPPLPRPDPGRAGLPGVPAGRSRCGRSSAPMPADRCRCTSPGTGGVLRHLRRPGDSAGAGPAPGRPPAARRRRPTTPNVIDAEVVEDDDDHGPPELPAPR